jgi:hypothetical protein
MCGFCNVCVCVGVGFVMFGCFGNMCTCVYCVLYCFVYVYLFVFLLSVLVWALLPPTDNSTAVSSSSSSSISSTNHNSFFRSCLHFYPLLYLLFCLSLPSLPSSSLHLPFLLPSHYSKHVSSPSFPTTTNTQSDSLFISWRCIQCFQRLKEPISSNTRHDAGRSS